MSGFFLVFGAFLFAHSIHEDYFTNSPQSFVSAGESDFSSDAFPDRLSHWVLTHSGHLISGTGLCLDAGEIRLRCRTPEGRTTEFRAKRDTVLAILVYPPVDPHEAETRLRDILGTKRLAELRETSRKPPDFDAPVWDLTVLLSTQSPQTSLLARQLPENGETDNFDGKTEKEVGEKTGTLFFLNGDRLDGRIMSIHRGFLRLQPENWQEFIVVPLRRVRTIRFAGAFPDQSVQPP